MMSSRCSATGTELGSRLPPRFILDRCLGAVVARRLSDAGWDVLYIGDLYPRDAEEVSDEDWIRRGGEMGCACLTKDKRIRRSRGFLVATEPVFALSDGNIALDEIVRRFTIHKSAIERAAISGAGDRQFWMVYESRIDRRV